MTGVLTILYVTNVAGFSIAQYGTLIAVQMVTSILVYIPAGKIADGIGRKPFVIATFLCFALVSNCDNLRFKLHFDRVAFVIGGLREIGEPARKAMIVDFCQGVATRALGRPLLSAAQFIDNASRCHRWHVVEYIARDALYPRRCYRNGWNGCFRRYR